MEDDLQPAHVACVEVMHIEFKESPVVTEASILWIVSSSRKLADGGRF